MGLKLCFLHDQQNASKVKKILRKHPNMFLHGGDKSNKGKKRKRRRKKIKKDEERGSQPNGRSS